MKQNAGFKRPKDTVIYYKEILAAMFFILLFIQSCKEKASTAIPDVSNIETNLKVIRFEQELFNIDTSDYQTGIESLKSAHPEFYKIFTEDILTLGVGFPKGSFSIDDTLAKYFIANAEMRKLYDTTSLVFHDFESTEKEIDNAYKFLKHYIPDHPVNPIYTYIAPFVYQVILADKITGLELDLYLGGDYPVYSIDPFNYPYYVSRRFEKPYIPVNIMKSHGDDLVPSQLEENDLLNHMIREGKVLYFLHKVLPNTADTLLTGFTQAQQAWCEFNEHDIWAYWVTEDLLYTKKMGDIQKLIGEAPNSQGMPSEAPGKTAVWTGYRIVKQFMKRNPKFTMKELFAESSGMKILQGSKYNP